MTRRWAAAMLAVMCGAASASATGESTQDKSADKEDARPEISLKVAPVIAFSPAKVTVRAEFRGGARDYEPFYCTTIVWDWDDGTTSENTPDCAPYEPGKSEIRRYLSNTHTYTMAGRYNVRFRMKKGDRVVGGSSTVVQVRPGIRDMSTEPPM